MYIRKSNSNQNWKWVYHKSCFIPQLPQPDKISTSLWKLWTSNSDLTFQKLVATWKETLVGKKESSLLTKSLRLFNFRVKGKWVVWFSGNFEHNCLSLKWVSDWELLNRTDSQYVQQKETSLFHFYPKVIIYLASNILCHLKESYHALVNWQNWQKLFQIRKFSL